MTESAEGRPEVQPFQHEDRLQFADGHLAYGFKTRGDVIAWKDHAHTRDVDLPLGHDTAIVTMQSGRRFALGSGAAVVLPPFDSSTGRFVRDRDEGGLTSASLQTIAPNGLSDMTIGEVWAILPDQGPVNDVLIDGDKVDHSQSSSAQQVGGLNPFSHAREILHEVADKMQAVGLIQP